MNTFNIPKLKFKELADESQRNKPGRNFDKYKKIIAACLSELHNKDGALFERNLCERCLVFRFASYLQKYFESAYVDCDYNASAKWDSTSNSWVSLSGKSIFDRNNIVHKRFVDIIVHKRLEGDSPDIICFEVKKWNSIKKEGFIKDKYNLIDLTTRFGYEYGFHLVFGETLGNTYLSVFANGKEIGKLSHE